MHTAGTAISSTPSTSKGVGGAALFAALIILAFGAAGENLDLTALAALSFSVGVVLLWRSNDTQILLVVYLFQWLQGTMPLFEASWNGVALDDLFDRPGLYSEAVFLTHVALICFAVGMRLAAPPAADQRARVTATLAGKPVQYWFVLYLVFFLIGNVALMAAAAAPGLAQIFLGFDNLRWAFFLMLAASSFSRGGASLLFLAAFAVELVLGFSGYFSEFKTVFVVSFLGLMISGARISARWILLAGLIGVAVAYVGVIWTAIKPEYRSYISGGARQQIVVVPFPDRMQKLVELSADVDQTGFSEGVEQLVGRIGYVEFFGGTLAHVPAFVPHEEGAILIDAVSRPFMPRYFFPDKEIIDDSVRTRIYTGWMVSGTEVGTSISLGWIAEMYIDFGRWGMLLAALFVGAFYGSIHRLLAVWTYSRGLLGSASAGAILINVMFLETSITKATGGLVAGVIATLLAIRFIVPLVSPYLTRHARARSA